MATILDTQITFGQESTYGTAVAATKSHKGISATINGKYGDPIVAEGVMGPGAWGVDEEMFVPNPKGADGELEFPVTKKGFLFWAKNSMGTETLDGSATQGIYDHVYTFGAKEGKSFTCQTNKVTTDGNDTVVTYAGGKITEFELTNDVDDFLIYKANVDFASETIGAGAGALAKQTPVYPSSPNAPFAFIGGDVDFDGTAIIAKNVSIKVSQGLDAERYRIVGSGTKLEPLQSERPNIEVEITAEYDDVALLNYAAATLATGKHGPATFTWNAPFAETGGATAQILVEMPFLRIDETPTSALNANGTLELSIKAVAMGSSPMTLTVKTPDAS